MKPQIEKVPICERMFLGECRTVADVQLVAKECENIQVLGLSADAVVLTAESLSGEVLFDGKINVKAIIKDDDDNLAGLNFGTDFADKFLNNRITADTKTEVCASVDDVSFKKEGNVIYAKCVIVTKIFAFAFESHELVCDCEGLQVKKQNALFCHQKAVAKKDITVVDEVESRHDIVKILMAQTNGIVSSVVCEDDVVSLKGDFFTCVTYVKEDNDVCSLMVKTPFEEEISASGADVDCIAFADIRQKSTKVSIELSNDSANEFTLEIQAQICATVFKNQSTSFVQDAFSMEYNIDLQTKSLQTCLPKEYIVHTCNADGVIDVQGVDEVLCITNPCVQISGKTFAEDCLVIKGVVCADLFFVSEEKVLSSPVQIPFESKVQTGSNFACEVINKCVTQISAKVVRGAISIESGLKFGINCYDMQKSVAVGNIMLLDKKADDGCAIEILTGKKGMTLWDVQKYLGMSEQDLLVCNPDLQLPLTQDKKILVYRKIQ